MLPTPGEFLSRKDGTPVEYSECERSRVPDGSDNACDFQVGMERPAEFVPRFPGEVLMDSRVARTSFRRADFDQWGLSEGCPGCPYLRAGQGRQQTHSEACRRRKEALLRGDSSGSARLAAADERVNRALADAVERHATKDPGVRGILKRASVVRHPESEPQKRFALDTEQDPTPHPAVLYGGSSAPGAQPSITTSTDQYTGTGDVTREARTGPTQDVIRASSSDDSGDVVMREDNADEKSASRRRITTMREPRDVRDAQTSVTEQHVPGRISGKTTL